MLILITKSKNFIMRRTNKIRKVLEKDEKLVEELNQVIEFVVN